MPQEHEQNAQTAPSSATSRERWVAHADRLARPMLEAIAHRQFRQKMPVEHNPDAMPNLADFAHLEGFSRLLMGVAPWLESDAADAGRKQLADLAAAGLVAGTDPASPDFFNFTEGKQPVVDGAFLAQAILRAPNLLWHSLTSEQRQNVINALKTTRRIKPWFNNWLLFSAMIETCLAVVGETDYDPMRIDYAVRQHEQWYCGDGAYGDGPHFHFDYYNSYVIQPMLLDILDHVAPIRNDWERLRGAAVSRAQRYAQVLERLIAPDGSYPPLGRSITYRSAAFQVLAQMAWQHRLPEQVSPAQARTGLTAVIDRVLGAPGTYDAAGWLQIGVCGHQPTLADRYICTGSLYLCSAAFLPLGLPADDPFWADPDQPTSGMQVWQGRTARLDHAED